MRTDPSSRSSSPESFDREPPVESSSRGERRSSSAFQSGAPDALPRHPRRPSSGAGDDGWTRAPVGASRLRQMTGTSTGGASSTGVPTPADVARQQVSYLSENAGAVGNAEAALSLLRQLPTKLRSPEDCRALERALDLSLQGTDDTLAPVSVWAHMWLKPALQDLAQGLDLKASFERLFGPVSNSPHVPGPGERAFPGHMIGAREDVAHAMRLGVTGHDAVEQVIAGFAAENGYHITNELDIEDLHQHAAQLTEAGGPGAATGHMESARSAIVGALRSGGIPDPAAFEHNLRAQFEQDYGYPLRDSEVQELREFAANWRQVDPPPRP